MTGFLTLVSKELLEQQRTWRFVGVMAFFSAVALLVTVIPFIVSLFTDIERDSEFARGLLEAYGGTTATLGALVAIVFGMGVLANERSSGTAGMVLSKPVSVAAFVSARFAGMASSIYLGFAAGSIVMFVLTTILIGYYNAATFAIYMSIIGFYLIFVSSMTFFWSGMFARQMLAGGIALVLFIIQLPLTAIPHTQDYWPVSLVLWASNTSGIWGGGRVSDAWQTFPIALACIALFVVGAWAIFRRKEL